MLFFSACAFSRNDINNQADQLKGAAAEALQQGKATVAEVERTSEAVRETIENKVNDLETATKEVQEAKEAMGQLFEDSQQIDLEREKSDLCTDSTECMVVEYKGCCSTLRAINKAYFEEYQNTPLWQSDDVDCTLIQCKDLSQLTATECKADPLGVRRCLLRRP